MRASMVRDIGSLPRYPVLPKPSPSLAITPSWPYDFAEPSGSTLYFIIFRELKPTAITATFVSPLNPWNSA